MSEPITIEVRGFGRPWGMNEVHGRHWSAVRKEKQRWHDHLLVQGWRGRKIPTPAVVQLTIYSARRMDDANAASCEKHPIDALVRLGALPEDNPDHITWLPVKQERCPHKLAGFRLEFYPQTP